MIRNYLAFIFVKVLNIFNKKKSNKYFIGLIYSNNMCRKVYNKIINKYSYSNIEILFHPGGGNKNEIDYFSSKKYYNYFTSNLDNKIINNSNRIKLCQNSELTLIEYNIGEKRKFFKNTK